MIPSLWDAAWAQGCSLSRWLFSGWSTRAADSYSFWFGSFTEKQVSPLSTVLCSVTQSCPTLRDPMDWGSSVHEISQANWSGLPFSPPGGLPDPGMEPACLVSPALGGRFSAISATCGHNGLQGVVPQLEPGNLLERQILRLHGTCPALSVNKGLSW